MAVVIEMTSYAGMPGIGSLPSGDGMLIAQKLKESGVSAFLVADDSAAGGVRWAREPSILSDNMARLTVRRLWEAFRFVASSLVTGDRLYIFFSGHGLQPHKLHWVCSSPVAMPASNTAMPCAYLAKACLPVSQVLASQAGQAGLALGSPI